MSTVASYLRASRRVHMPRPSRMTPRADSPAASRRIGYPTVSSSVTSHGKGARDSRHSLKNARNGCCHAREHSKDAGASSWVLADIVEPRVGPVDPRAYTVEPCGESFIPCTGKVQGLQVIERASRIDLFVPAREGFKFVRARSNPARNQSKDAGECCNDARNCSYPCGEGVEERGGSVEPLVRSIETCGASAM
jgi:hypothetical protein